MSNNDVELNRTGNRLIAQRAYQAARATFEQLVSQSPDNPDGYIGLAKALSRQGDYHAIVRQLENVVDRLGSDQLVLSFADALRVLANRGESQYLKPAIEYYSRYHRKRKDQVTLFYQGELMIQAGDLSAAAEVLRTSWEQDRRSREVFNCLIGCLDSLKRPDEIQILQRLMDQQTKT